MCNVLELELELELELDLYLNIQNKLCLVKFLQSFLAFLNIKIEVTNKSPQPYSTINNF